MERKSGVLMHISSLWGEYSSGSFGKEAFEFIDFLKAGGFSYWQVLPFVIPDECNSPYKSYSTFGGNPYFVNLDYLYNDGLLSKEDLNSAKQYIKDHCFFQYVTEYDMRKRGQLEGLFSYLLDVRYVDKEH